MRVTRVGPLIYLYAYGRDIIIINSAKAADELLNKRGVTYARRPTWSMVALTGRHNNIAFMDNTERQRKSRAIMQAALNPMNQKIWGPVLEDESEKLMYEILKAPEGYKIHIKRFVRLFFVSSSAFVIVTVTVRRAVSYVDTSRASSLDSLTELRWTIIICALQKCFLSILSKRSDRDAGLWTLFPRVCHWIPYASLIVPTLICVLLAAAYLVIYLPEWLPGMGFKRWARNAREMFLKFTSEPYAKARASVVSISPRTHD